MTEVGKEKFDGLGRDYDRFRPRYPAVLFDAVVAGLTGTGCPAVVDTGAGTGVALEGLLPRLPEGARVDAVDVSADMVTRGREKFPTVDWHVGPAEPFLEQCRDVDLVVAAQAYQWMDRPRFRQAAARCLTPGGLVAVMQNNRDFIASRFLDAYEALLEEMSPGYARFYRSFDIRAELEENFELVRYEPVAWERRMSAEDFHAMSHTSTQAQRAVSAHGPEFGRRLSALLDEYQSDGNVTIAYTSEAFIASRPRGVAAR